MHSILHSDLYRRCSTKLLHPSSADENNLVLFYIVVVDSSVELGYPFVSVADSPSPQSLRFFCAIDQPDRVSSCAHQSCSPDRRSLWLLNACGSRVTSSTCLNLSVRHGLGHITHLLIVPRRTLSSQESRLLYTAVQSLGGRVRTIAQIGRVK